MNIGVLLSIALRELENVTKDYMQKEHIEKIGDTKDIRDVVI